MVLLPPGFAAFQNCFCAEYLFIGHSLKRQSEEIKQEENVTKHHPHHCTKQISPLATLKRREKNRPNIFTHLKAIIVKR